MLVSGGVSSLQPVYFCHSQLNPCSQPSSTYRLTDFFNASGVTPFSDAAYLKTEFVLPNNLTYADKCAIEKVLSFFEPVEVEDTIWDLDLQINCDNQLYESLKKPSIHPMKMIEKGEETVHLFGHEYVIAEQQISIPRPVIKNTDEVRDALLSGGQPTAKIVSYTGKLVLRCKMKQM